MFSCQYHCSHQLKSTKDSCGHSQIDVVKNSGELTTDGDCFPAGTGLGLASVQQIVVGLHGGESQTASELGAGTEFTTILPAKNIA